MKDSSPNKRSQSQKRGTQSDKNKETKTERKSQHQIRSKKSVEAKSKTEEELKDETVGKTLYSKPHSTFPSSIIEDIPYFKEHIQIDPNNNKRFICKICKSKNNSDHSGYYDNLLGHLCTNAHEIATPDKKELEIGINKFKMLRNRNARKLKNEINSQDITQVRFFITTWILKNHLPFSLTEDLMNFLSELTSKFNKETLEASKMSRKMTREIATHCIAATLKEEIASDLKSCYFSLSTDLGSDNFGEKYFPIMATYFKENKIENKLVTLLKVKSDSTGKTLYEMVKKELFCGQDAHLVEKHFMGIASDKGGNLLAVRAGLANRLIKDYSYSIAVHDYCHIFNLVCEAAMEAFPESVVKTIKTISAHFKQSPMRKAIFREVQIERGVGKNETKEILSYVPTRWFSLNDSIKRILELWDLLEIYFEQEGYNDELNLFNVENELMIKLLGSLIEKLNFYNKRFESQNKNYLEIRADVEEAFIIFGRLVSANPKANFEQLYSQSFENFNPNTDKLTEELKNSLISISIESFL